MRSLGFGFEKKFFVLEKKDKVLVFVLVWKEPWSWFYKQFC